MFSSKFLLLKTDTEYIVMFQFALETKKIKTFCLIVHVF